MAPKHDSKTESGSRWSIEEVKNLFMRPFSGSSSRNSDRDSNLSFGGLRWSLEDIKDKFFGASEKDADGKTKKKSKRKQLTPEERQARRQERLEARKAKKSKREKERRSNVNGLFDQLGSMLKVTDNKKGARLSILSAAVDKLKEKEGRHDSRIDEEDDEDDYHGRRNYK
mmetsp:Transcript_118/g.285  ORF Transcript_118/g.285 Transcript_118/m.285 type:complete len:170 (+) Transcript_118:114-623(+)